MESSASQPKEAMREAAYQEAKAVLSKGKYPELVQRIGGDVFKIEPFTDPGQAKMRAEELTARLEIGSSQRLLSSGLVDGYYGGWETGPNGQRVFNPATLRLDRWAKKVKFDNLDATTDVSADEQTDLLRGYFGLMLQNSSFRVGELVQTLARAEADQPQQTVDRYKDAIDLAATSQPKKPEHKQGLDQMMQQYGYMWSESTNTYEKGAQATFS